MTIKKARKILGKAGEELSDKQLKKELEVADFLSELLLQAYPDLQITENKVK